ncbi:MAG: DUF1992 domain-containing protein [Proteobacteria bacterium]|nr:DUF1992 domain-containing protein [Pseudomonadota bacterium]
MIEAIRIIAERKIKEAIKEGLLDIKEWRNRPLPPSNDCMIPDDLRIAYKMLKNAGYVPPEIEAKKEIQQLEDLIAATEDEHTRVKQIKKLNYLVMKLDAMRGDSTSLENQETYYRKVVEKLSVTQKS